MRKTIKAVAAITLSGSMFLTGCASSSSSKETSETSKENSTGTTTVADDTTASENDTTASLEETSVAEKTDAEETSENETNTTHVVEQGNDIDLTDYSMVWEDQFEGTSLNTDDWNYELHEPGWVNNELQAYVQSDDNIYLKDGKLVIKPIKTFAGYTSGRVNTQGKHDFTYGIFEASIKMPSGKGFLPAFWMMPTDENLYGQWPRCGEIDIAEVLGNNTKVSYGTVHFGNPHSESQRTYTLTEGDFAEEFHTYTVEWLPGELKWYVDGNLIHTENDWYTTTEGLGTATYPAPFDQPFYMILNLAVGGNWPGNPDETTDIENATMEIDYVRVYQKASYDENVIRPEKEVVLRDPDENGNYINNSDFSDEEALDDSTDWNFLTALEGKGSAEIKDNAIVITTENDGTADYSIQLVHWNVPFQKGAEYRITFDAWADEARSLKVAVTAPEVGWIRYFDDTLTDITTEKQTFTYDFVMKEADDGNGRLEFNMGNLGQTATVYITNVKVEKTAEGSAEPDAKTVLSDGNYVYNASFREGENRVGDWEFDGDGSYEVTTISDGRRLHVDTTAGALAVGQQGLALSTDSNYMLSFEIEGTKGAQIGVIINNKETKYELDGGRQDISEVIGCSGEENSNNLIFRFYEGAEFYLDNVRVVENVKIKNGSFSAGTSGYEIYVDSSASASYVVDSLSEDNAIDFTVNKTGDADWKIQLKQNKVLLENGKTYTLKFDAKSSMNREIRAILQGGESLGWPVYSDENIVSLTEEYQTFTTTFTMTADTDPAAFLSICLGAVSGNVIDEQHRVCIDNISLVEE